MKTNKADTTQKLEITQNLAVLPLDVLEGVNGGGFRGSGGPVNRNKSNGPTRRGPPAWMRGVASAFGRR